MWVFLFFLIVLLFLVFPVAGKMIVNKIMQVLFGKLNNSSSRQQNTSRRTSDKRKKLIHKNEGEYVDFEEIVDDKIKKSETIPDN
jgi:hypothetical protein